jgi:hypothetical protein
VLPCELAISLTAGDTISAHKETAPALSGKNEDRPLPATDSPSHAAPLQKGEGGVADEKLPREVGRLPTGEAVELDGNTLRIATGDPLRIQSFLDGLRSRGQVICAVRRLRQSLEDFFVQIVSEPSSPAPSPTTQTQKGRQ